MSGLFLFQMCGKMPQNITVVFLLRSSEVFGV